MLMLLPEAAESVEEKGEGFETKNAMLQAVTVMSCDHIPFFQNVDDELADFRVWTDYRLLPLVLARHVHQRLVIQPFQVGIVYGEQLFLFIHPFNPRLKHNVRRIFHEKRIFKRL